MRLLRRLSLLLFILTLGLVVSRELIRSTDLASYMGFYRLFTGGGVNPVFDPRARIIIFFAVSGLIAAGVFFLIPKSLNRPANPAKSKLMCILSSFLTWILFLSFSLIIMSAYECMTGSDLWGRIIHSKKLILFLILTAAASSIPVAVTQKKPKIAMILMTSVFIAADLFFLTSDFFISRSLYRQYEVQREIYDVRSMIEQEKTVIHACGSIDNYSYTNSYDALVNAYDKGNRICEIDFNLTSDGRLIAGHDNGDTSWVVGIDSTEALSYEEFLDRKYLGRFDTMGIDELARFMREHEDLYVVTDIKGRDLTNVEGCALIAQECPDLKDRFIIQIYHISEYVPVRQLGFKNIIYTLYATCEEERNADLLLQIMNDCDLLGFTFWSYWDGEPFVAPVKDKGALEFVHTVNDPSIINDFIGRGFYIYTDNTDNSALRE